MKEKKYQTEQSPTRALTCLPQAARWSHTEKPRGRALAHTAWAISGAEADLNHLVFKEKPALFLQKRQTGMARCYLKAPPAGFGSDEHPSAGSGTKTFPGKPHHRPRVSPGCSLLFVPRDDIPLQEPRTLGTPNATSRHLLQKEPLHQPPATATPHCGERNVHVMENLCKSKTASEAAESREMGVCGAQSPAGRVHSTLLLLTASCSAPSPQPLLDEDSPGPGKVPAPRGSGHAAPFQSGPAAGQPRFLSPRLSGSQ